MAAIRGSGMWTSRRSPPRPTITQEGRTISIEARGFDLEEDDFLWLNAHRGVLKRLRRSLCLTFPSERVAREALEEMVTLGAIVDRLERPIFLDDTVAGLVERLLGRKGTGS